MKPQWLFITLLMAILAGCDKQTQNTQALSPEPGTAEAAKAMAPEFITKAFVFTEDPVIDGDTAKINTTIINQKCMMVMKRSGPENESKYGWLISTLSCEPSDLHRPT